MFRYFLLTFLIILAPEMMVAQDTLTWRECLQQVVRHSPAVEQARWDIRDVETQQDFQFGEYLPSLSLSVNSRVNQQGPREVLLGAEPFLQSGSVYQYHSTSLSLSYLLFDWGNRLRERQALASSLQGDEAALTDQKRQVAVDAFTRYAQLLESEDILGIYQQEVTGLKKQQTLVTRLIDSGLRPATDAARMQVQLASLQSQMITQREQAREYRRDLAVLMGRPQDADLTPQPLPVPSADSLAFPDTQGLWASQPVLNQLRFQIRTSKTQEDIQKWSMFPNLSLSGSYSRGDRQFDQVYGNWPRNWYTLFGLNISVPLFRNNDQQLQLERQKIQTRRLQTQFQRQQETTLQDLNRLRAQYAAARQQYRLGQSSVKSLQQIYDFEQGRYQAGTGEYQDVLDALRSLLSGQQSLITTKYQMLVTHFTLEVMAGRWDSL